MSLFDVSAHAIGETVVFVIRRVVGRTFHVEPRRAQRIAEYILIGLIAVAGFVLTLVYS